MNATTIRKAMRELREQGYEKVRHNRQEKIIEYYKVSCEGNYWANTQVITDGDKIAYIN